MTAQNWLWMAAAICQTLAVVFTYIATTTKDKLDTESTQETRAQISQGTRDTRDDIAKVGKKLDEIHSSLTNLPQELAAERTKQVEAVEDANSKVLEREFPFGYGLLRLEDNKRWFFWPRLKPGGGEFDWSKTQITKATPTAITVMLPDYLDPMKQISIKSTTVSIGKAVGREVTAMQIFNVALVVRVLASDESSLTVAVGAQSVP